MKTDALYEKYYYRRRDFARGWAYFQDLIQVEVPRRARVLEIGAGPTNFMSEYLARHFRTEGVDISDEVLENKFLESARVYDGKVLPYENESFDACVSYFVMEHVEDPTAHLKEVARVLRRGGAYLICTPNLWHYVPLASRLLPHWTHLKLANRLRGLEETAHDPYPTFYKANTPASVVRAASTAGLSVTTMNMVEPEPSYGRCHSVMFYPMMAYERVVNSSPRFAPFRVNIHAVLRKPQKSAGD